MQEHSTNNGGKFLAAKNNHGLQADSATKGGEAVGYTFVYTYTFLLD